MSHILISCIVETPMICTLPKSQRAQKHNKVHLDEKSIPGSDQGLMSDGIFIFILLDIIVYYKYKHKSCRSIIAKSKLGKDKLKMTQRKGF